MKKSKKDKIDGVIQKFLVEDAVKYGLNEAILLEDLRFWLRSNVKKSRCVRDGRVWTFSSVATIVERVPYLTRYQVRAAIDELTKRGIVIKSQYNGTNYDKTTWYSINSTEFLVPLSDDNAIEKSDASHLRFSNNRSIRNLTQTEDPKTVKKPQIDVRNLDNRFAVFEQPIQPYIISPSIKPSKISFAVLPKNEGVENAPKKNMEKKFRAPRGLAPLAPTDENVSISSDEVEDVGKPDKTMDVAEETSRLVGNTPDGQKITFKMVNEAIWLLRELFPMDAKLSFSKPPTRNLVAQVLRAYTPERLVSLVTSYTALLRTSQYAPRHPNVYSFFKYIDRINDFINESELKTSKTFLQDSTRPSPQELSLFHAYGLTSWMQTPLLNSVVDDLIRTQSDNPLVTKHTTEKLRKYVYLGAVTASIHNAQKTEASMRKAYAMTVSSGLGDILESGQWPLNWQTRQAEAMWEMPVEDMLNDVKTAELPEKNQEQ